MIHYISGGERSGKSQFAQDQALALSSQPRYLATSRVWDSDFKGRIQRHRQDRDERWTTIEEEVHLSQRDYHKQVVVLDCITLWLTNIYTDHEHQLEPSLQFAQEELDRLFQQEADWIIISNELGMGLHAPTSLGRKFVELQGWINQMIAKRADKATFMVSGLPLQLK